MKNKTIEEMVQQGAELVDVNTAAEILMSTPGTLAVWRCKGRYALPFVKIGKRVRYRLSDLKAFIDQGTHSNGSGA